MAVIKSIRNIRAEADAAPSKKLRAVILCADGKEEVVKAGERYIEKLANITEIIFAKSKADVPEEVMSAVVAEQKFSSLLMILWTMQQSLNGLRRKRKSWKAKLSV